ncbi:MAG: DUF3108 domain-containing protein [Neptuniibacter sp.]
MPNLKTQINGLFIFATFLSWALVSEATEDYSLKAFSASYEIDWQGGLSLNGSTLRELKKDDKGHWTFQSKASALFASVAESSQFLWQNQLPIPLDYHFKRSVLGKKRIAHVSFDWESLTVTNTVENKPWKMSISNGVQDKLSYQLLLQKDLSNGLTEFNYTVADGGKLKEYKFTVDGTEIIEAPIGTYKSIRVKRLRDNNNTRQTFIWFAPALDYQIIKLHQVEKKDKAYTLLLKELKL